MAAGFHCSAEFSIRQARGIVRDLFDPDPRIYWADFLGSLLVGYGTFSLVLRLPPLSAAQAAAFLVSCLALYRASLFTHELSHLRDPRFRLFRLAWDVLCGIPMLIPSFTYDTHLAHHARRHYGTREDGEYLPLGHGPAWLIVGYLAEALVVPFLAVVRFLILSPLGWMLPGFRRWVQQHASSMVIDPRYVRPVPKRRELNRWFALEAGCWVYLLGLAALILGGRLPAALILQSYLTAVTVLSINAVRTLGAHRFRHTGGEVTFLEQVLDSYNYPERPWWNELWAPVGLRFHALHHLFPSLPYHHLAEAHRRLMEQLPAHSPYRQTNSPSLWASLRRLACEVRESGRRRRESAGNTSPQPPSPSGDVATV